MATYGYIRVSTDKQTTDNQKKAILEAGFSVDAWYSESGVSGSTKANNRPEFSKMLDSTALEHIYAMQDV